MEEIHIMKHLQTFEDFNILNEIGDMSAGYYDVKGPFFENEWGKDDVVYKFETKSGLKYRVIFYDKRSDIEVWFEVTDTEDKQIPMHTTTNKGELYQVMATTFGIIDHYFTSTDAGQPYGIKDEMSPFQMHMDSNTDNPPDMMRIEPTKEQIWDQGPRESDKRREKLYMQYLKKQGYKARVVGDAIVVDISEYIK